MKNFIKNNKVTVVAFIICVIFVILVFAVKLTFFPNEGTAIYGDRLDGIEEVEITDNMTAGELHDILMERGGELLVRTIKGILNNEITPEKQNEEETCNCV